MLKNILESRKCFKLVCGAGNEDTEEVKKLVALYSKAGCNLFDISANEEVLDAAKRGLNFSISKDEQNDYHFCVSVGIKGDPHVQKAIIDPAKCIFCQRCVGICPQKTIYSGNKTCEIRPKKCIGCAKCLKVCPPKAITLYSEEKNLREILPPLVKKGIDCIEFHAIIDDEAEVLSKWDDINSCYNGLLSICIDRYKLGNERLVARLKALLKTRKPYTTIIQADGAPMSGGVDDYKTTLQAVATAEIVQDAELPVYILLSGGTNSKSAELATLCGIEPNGIAIGSYARQIVKEYIDREDFLTNQEVFEQALNKAKALVNICIKKEAP